ncbi:hypothetical protein F183_A09360 [Bryobacterales bacterium F-183]|nr:hypothetical protein F183_A09360 [Bryobacterales bacterium F-183]
MYYYGSIEWNARVKLTAGDSDHSIGTETEATALQGHLESRGVFPVVDQAIREA